MSNNEEILTEEDTFEETNNSYELDAVEYDDNDEGTVEYLDLDLEVDSIPESAEEYIPEVATPKAKVQAVRSSVLKPNLRNTAKLKRKQTQKTNRAKQQTAIALTPNILRSGSATENAANANSTSQAVKRKIDCPASANVHAAVNVINAKLADSAQSMNGLGGNNSSNERVEFDASSNEDSEASPSSKSGARCEVDSLDLFFQSMAQTVLHLPSQVQAKIKMDIYKVIAMAEIKYGTLKNSEANKV